MKEKLKYSSQVNRKLAVERINDLLAKVEEGIVKLETDNKSMELNLPDNLTLNIKTEKNEEKNKKRKITIQLKWYEENKGSSPNLKIS
ncbi:MAG: amphi-Trp domain-containing protein [Myxococcota bacterium]